MTTETKTRPDASMATDRDSWLARMDEIGEDAGYFEPVGKAHWAFFADEGPNLLVTFETLDQIRAGSAGQMPMGWTHATGRDWSHLCLIADGDTWYRDRAVYGYFDRLVDDAFFEDFDRVVFYGAGMGGYAACAFSVAAPGATVVAIQPRATLDPRIAGWDRRHLDCRRLNFTDRYGHAPDMIEGTGEVFVIHDPWQREDAMHAALFARPFVTQLRVPHLGGRIEASLGEMEALPEILDAACDGDLSAARFARIWRKRRTHAPYLKRLLTLTEVAGHPARSAMVCHSVVGRLDMPPFDVRLSDLEQAMVTR